MKHPAVLLAGILLLLPATLVTYRILWLKYPLSLTIPGKAWQLSMQAEVQADKNGIQVEIGLPFSSPHQRIVSELISSGGLDFDLVRNRPNRIGHWSVVELEEKGAFITYRATILESPRPPVVKETPLLGSYPPTVRAEDQALAERLAARWRDLPPPARFLALSTAVASDWRITFRDKRDLRAWLSVEKKYGKVTAFLVLLRAAALPARAVEGLQLVDSVRTKPLRWVEVWTGKEWKRLVLVAGVIDPKSTSLLPLATGLPAVVQSVGKLLEIRWTIIERKLSAWILHFDRIRRSNRWLDRWSLFHLPREFQNTFRILLLVPISALLIGFFRNVIGFPTFGIFMPVLMALAFRNTGLLYGLGIFSFVIVVGYGFRGSLNNLRLLLVPRLSVLLSMVVAFVTIFAVIGNLYRLREFMAVGLLPIVILTMTIERFFIITEEAGLREAFRTAVGTAAVASITYWIINWDPLQLMFYLYPELILAVAALQVLLGRYTGFRLLELSRFRDLERA
jgi:hypothetical protein